MNASTRDFARLRAQANRSEQHVERLHDESALLRIKAELGQKLYDDILKLVENEAPRRDYLAAAKAYELAVRGTHQRFRRPQAEPCMYCRATRVCIDPACAIDDEHACHGCKGTGAQPLRS